MLFRSLTFGDVARSSDLACFLSGSGGSLVFFLWDRTHIQVIDQRRAVGHHFAFGSLSIASHFRNGVGDDVAVIHASRATARQVGFFESHHGVFEVLEAFDIRLWEVFGFLWWHDRIYTI